MLGETHVIANRRGAENPPRRHRDRIDDLEFGDEGGFGSILRAVGVFVVKDSQTGHAQHDLIMQNKANSRKAGFAIMAL